MNIESQLYEFCKNLKIIKKKQKIFVKENCKKN